MSKTRILLLQLQAAVAIIIGLACFSACSKSVPNTQIMVQDSIRHYYPLVQGSDLTLYWRVANVGSTPLVITDIQPSCGCIIESATDDNVIAPGNEALLRFTFNSDKFSGYVHHSIRLFGNMNTDGMACLTFDLNVIAPPNGTPEYERPSDKDHEEILEEEEQNTKKVVERSKRDYWTDANEYPDGLHREYWDMRDNQ